MGFSGAQVASRGRVVLLLYRGQVAQKSYLLAYANVVDLNSPKDIHNMCWILGLWIKQKLSEQHIDICKKLLPLHGVLLGAIMITAPRV